MTKTNNPIRYSLSAFLLASILAMTTAQPAQATSIPALWDIEYFEGTFWRVKELDGQQIPQENAPWLLFSGNVLTVDLGCRAFTVTGIWSRDLTLTFLKPQTICAPITPQEVAVIKVFQNHIGFTPYDTNEFQGIQVVEHSGQAGIIAVKSTNPALLPPSKYPPKTVKG